MIDLEQKKVDVCPPFFSEKIGFVQSYLKI